MRWGGTRCNAPAVWGFSWGVGNVFGRVWGRFRGNLGRKSTVLARRSVVVEDEDAMRGELDVQVVREVRPDQRMPALEVIRKSETRGGAAVVEEDEDVARRIRADAAAEFDVFREVGDFYFHVCLLDGPCGGGEEQVVVEHCAAISDATVTASLRDHCRVSVKPISSAVSGIGHYDFGRRERVREGLGPDGGVTAAPFAGEIDLVLQGVILIDVGAERGGEGAGLALGLEGVELVFHAGARAEEEVAAVIDPVEEFLRGGVGDDVETGGDD